MEPNVSVIVPNYNHELYLRERIESILHQTYSDFELIILDDASSDRSREIIDEYRNHPLVQKIVFNEKNSGSPFRQWRRGIELARGRWIWLAESDDYADVHFLETLLNAVQDHPDVGLIYCDSKVLIHGTVEIETFADIKNRKFQTNRWSKDYINSGLNEIEDYLLGGGTINNTSAVLFRKDILNSINPFDIELKHIGDKYTFIKVLSMSSVLYSKEALNYYRNPFMMKHTNKYSNYFFEQFLVFDWVYRNMEIKNRKKFFEAFFSNTRNSLVRDWGSSKIKIYAHLFSVNPGLLIKSIVHNFAMSLNSLFGEKK